MGKDVEVSYDGMRSLAEMSREQYLSLSEASGFVCSSGMSNTGAFSGFLGVFKGTYSDALASMNESIGTSMAGAHDLAEAIADTRVDYQRTDTAVTQLHTKLEYTLECKPSAPAIGGGGGLPDVPDAVGHGAGGYGAVRDATGANEGGDSATSPLDLYDNLGNLIDNSTSFGEGLDDGDDMDDYIDRMNQKRGSN